MHTMFVYLQMNVQMDTCTSVDVCTIEYIWVDGMLLMIGVHVDM